MDTLPIQEVKNMAMTYLDSGTIKMKMVSPMVCKLRPKGMTAYTEYPQGLKASSHKPDGQKEATMTALYAVDFEGTNMMIARKNVVIINHTTGDTIKTERIKWDRISKEISSDTTVIQCKTDGSVLYGDGFTANETFSRWTIHNLRGSLYMNE